MAQGEPISTISISIKDGEFEYRFA